MQNALKDNRISGYLLLKLWYHTLAFLYSSRLTTFIRSTVPRYSSQPHGSEWTRYPLWIVWLIGLPQWGQISLFSLFQNQWRNSLGVGYRFSMTSYFRAFFICWKRPPKMPWLITYIREASLSATQNFLSSSLTFGGLCHPMVYCSFWSLATLRNLMGYLQSLEE